MSGGSGQREAQAAGTVRTVEPLCGPAGGPRGSKLTGFIGVKGFPGAKEEGPFDLIPSTFCHVWACRRICPPHLCPYQLEGDDFLLQGSNDGTAICGGRVLDAGCSGDKGGLLPVPGEAGQCSLQRSRCLVES